MTASIIRWEDGAYAGDDRRLAWCGKVPIGAVFVPSRPRGRYYRWRVWVTSRMNPVDGVERSIEAAQREVERRFADFLMLADLEPARKAG